jgi:hypothetical protein
MYSYIALLVLNLVLRYQWHSQDNETCIHKSSMRPVFIKIKLNSYQLLLIMSVTLCWYNSSNYKI